MEIVNRNLGDSVIADNAAYLIKESIPLIAKKHCELRHYNYRSMDYELIKSADLIIFCGGGIIKYKQEEFHIYMPEILKCAEKYKIPVYFNGVGIEGYEANDKRCQHYKRALNYSCVKGIGVRDDISTLEKYLYSDHIFRKEMIDPAVYTPDVYHIKRNKKSKIIGLGIVRWKIFEDNGLPQITREFQLEMWKGIINELENHGYSWKLFVNGMPADYEFAEDLLEYIGESKNADYLLMKRPITGKELVEDISSFSGIIACRMHANIIAYSLGIPSIGLVWNEKLVFWGNRIGYPERFLRSNQFDPKIIVNQLLKSINLGVKPCTFNMKMSVYQPLRSFVLKYSFLAYKYKRKKWVKNKTIWSEKLVATALGGLELRWPNSNSRQSLEHALKMGFQNFEADIRLTLDGKLVCVNGWTPESYEMLGKNPKLFDHNGMTYKEFCKCRAYANHYNTIDTFSLLKILKKKKNNWKLILDIGTPETKTLSKIIQELKKFCRQNAYWKPHLLIRLQCREDVHMLQASKLPVQLMYNIPEGELRRKQHNETVESITTFCIKNKIEWISMEKDDPFSIHEIEKDTILYLKKHKLKICIFTYNTYTEVKQALELGVDWIATSYLSVNDMESCYQHKIKYSFK